jgi:hypothetical protein
MVSAAAAVTQGRHRHTIQRVTEYPSCLGLPAPVPQPIFRPDPRITGDGGRL